MRKEMDHVAYPKSLKSKSIESLRYIREDAFQAAQAMPDGENLKYKYERIAFLKDMLKTDSRWAIRGLLRIYEDQTAEEQAVGHTHEHNGVGFTG
jgi:hypothetical protein